MSQSGSYLMNAWYVAALSQELSADTLFDRTLLDIPVVLYRRADGTPIAMLDRCPHRFAPLSMGRLEQDSVICPYHGLRFDCTGTCNHNPHGPGTISPRAKVPTYPVIERFGFIWIWLGDADADESLLPHHPTLVSGHEHAVAYTYMPRDCHYELIIDNVMDLSHVDHLHGEMITTRGQLSPQIPDVIEADGTVSVRWLWQQTPPILILNDFLPQPGQPARHFVEVTWSAPSHIQLTIGATQESAVETLNFDNTVAQYDFHTCTPESATSTHYFFASRRNHHEEDAEFNQLKIQGMHNAFVDEDGPLLDRLQQRMGSADFFSLNPVLISSDAGPVRVRRILAERIAEEQAQDG